MNVLTTKENIEIFFTISQPCTTISGSVNSNGNGTNLNNLPITIKHSHLDELSEHNIRNASTPFMSI